MYKPIFLLCHTVLVEHCVTVNVNLALQLNTVNHLHLAVVIYKF